MSASMLSKWITGGLRRTSMADGGHTGDSAGVWLRTSHLTPVKYGHVSVRG